MQHYMDPKSDEKSKEKNDNKEGQNGTNGTNLVKPEDQKKSPKKKKNLGSMTGRHLESGASPLGQYSWMTFRGANAKKLCIISAY